MKYTVYVLKSLKYNKTYVGSTDNLFRRIKEHNQGKSIYTRRYRPWKLIYKEKYNTLIETRLREKELKSKKGRTWMKVNLFK